MSKGYMMAGERCKSLRTFGNYNFHWLVVMNTGKQKVLRKYKNLLYLAIGMAENTENVERGQYNTHFCLMAFLKWIVWV